MSIQVTGKRRPRNRGIQPLALPDPGDYLALLRRIRAALASHSPMVQGSVLTELLSIWLAGHPPELRRPLFGATLEIRQGVPRVKPCLSG